MKAVNCYFENLCKENWPFARWGNFTTTAGIHVVFPFVYIFGNPNLQKKADSGRIINSKKSSSGKWPITLLRVL